MVQQDQEKGEDDDIIKAQAKVGDLLSSHCFSIDKCCVCFF